MRVTEAFRADLNQRGIDKLPVLCRYRRPLVFFTWLLRMAEFHSGRAVLASRIKAAVFRMRCRRYGMGLGLTVPPGVFAGGLLIVHWGSVVVSGQARVGKNCRIHSCVNIGASADGAPVIGDNVYIGPGAKIFGAITIGDNVKIGANAVVNKSFGDDISIGGIPARILEKSSAQELPA